MHLLNEGGVCLDITSSSLLTNNLIIYQVSTKSVSSGLGYAGYGLGYGGYGLGYGHAIWKREAEAEPSIGYGLGKHLSTNNAEWELSLP